MTRYMLTKRGKEVLKGKNFDLHCQRCKKEVNVGDMIESKPSKYKKHKLYHAECYDAMFIEVSDEEDAELEAELRELEEMEKSKRNGVAFLDVSVDVEVETS